MIPTDGKAWMRWVERRIGYLETHNHPDPLVTSPDAMLLAAARTGLRCDGIRTVTANSVTWTNELYVGGIGSSTAGPNGYIVIPVPSDGPIPVHGNTGSASASGGVITMPSGACHLYYDMPVGEEPSSGYHVVQRGPLPLSIPPRWVRIVSRVSVPGIPWVWGDGRHQDFERYPVTQNGWTNYGGAYADASCIKNNDFVHLGGVVRNGTVGDPIITLPAGYRPGTNRMFVVNADDAHGRINVTPVGNVILTTGSNNYVSLDGISFRYEQ